MQGYPYESLAPARDVVTSFQKRAAQYSSTLAAVFTGLFLYLIFFSLWMKEPHIIPMKHLVPIPTPTAAVQPKCGPGPHGDHYNRPGFGSFVSPAEETEWSFERLQEAVKATKGYYSRDYSLWLGWNNMRYIIEAGMLQASLLNRTLVIPSFVYARACEHDIHVCAAYAEMVNRGDALNSDEWRELPPNAQMGWRVPINLMFDLVQMRKHVTVITTSEFLRIHKLPLDLESHTGSWNREIDQLRQPNRPSVHYVPNSEYDPDGVIRVDQLPVAPSDISPASDSRRQTKDIGDVLGNSTKNFMLDIITAEQVLDRKGLKTWNNRTDFENILWEHGWAVLETFHPAGPAEWMKTVVNPITQVAARHALRGWVDDYDNVKADVLVLDGETHLYRKPGQMRFTSAQARDDYAQLVLQGLQPLPAIRELGRRLAQRMLDMNRGRMWMAGHMRRGDFARLGWSLSPSLSAHFTRIKNGLDFGRNIVKGMLKDGTPIQICDSPRNEVFPNAELPAASDKFYLMTDERSPDGLAYVRSHGAVLIQDLLTPEDRRLVAWPIMISDVLAILEQTLAGHAAYFYAQSASSVAGGVVNMRAAKGFDVRTAYVG